MSEVAYVNRHLTGPVGGRTPLLDAAAVMSPGDLEDVQWAVGAFVGAPAIMRPWECEEVRRGSPGQRERVERLAHDAGRGAPALPARRVCRGTHRRLVGRRPIRRVDGATPT